MPCIKKHGIKGKKYALLTLNMHDIQRESAAQHQECPKA